MDNISELTIKMAMAVNNSEEYGSYKRIKEKIKNDGPLYEEMKNFRRMHMEFQEKVIHDKQASFEEECVVSRKYFELMKNEKAAEFFKAEEAVIEMLARVYDLFGKECKVELEF